MGKIKGCSNETCEAHNKKSQYKESETFCSKCGNPLVFVCKGCYTQLSHGNYKYCVRCNAKHEDRKDRAKRIVAGAGAGALAVGGVVLTIGKKTFEFVKKIKD